MFIEFYPHRIACSCNVKNIDKLLFNSLNYRALTMQTERM